VEEGNDKAILNKRMFTFLNMLDFSCYFFSSVSFDIQSVKGTQFSYGAELLEPAGSSRLRNYCTLAVCMTCVSMVQVLIPAIRSLTCRERIAIS
jgi:hypothetical protein